MRLNRLGLLLMVVGVVLFTGMRCLHCRVQHKHRKYLPELTTTWDNTLMHKYRITVGDSIASTATRLALSPRIKILNIPHL